ncbi:MAG: TolC family protein, partial [Spirochaetia bacterium]|nr:TolC family protein [Spirochaetia bacterium]
LQSSAALLRKSEAEHRLGGITALDVAEIRNQFKQRELALRKEENGYTDALNDFALFLRMPEKEIPAIKVLDLSSLIVSPLKASKDDMVRTAQENRPDLRQARVDRLKSEMQYRIAERYYLPTISLTGHYGKTGDKWPPRTLEWGVGINISFPIAGSSVKNDGSVNHSKNESQRSVSTGGSVDIYDNAAWQEPKLRGAMEVMRTKDKQEVLARQVELTIERLVRDYDDRKRSLELADEALAVRDRRFEIELKKYESGETSLTDLFTEEVKLISARQALIKERVDFALSVNQLELELGLDLDELGLITFVEHDTDTGDVVKRSWTPRTKIEIPKLRFEEGR